MENHRVRQSPWNVRRHRTRPARGLGRSSAPHRERRHAVLAQVAQNAGLDSLLVCVRATSLFQDAGRCLLARASPGSATARSVLRPDCSRTLRIPNAIAMTHLLLRQAPPQARFFGLPAVFSSCHGGQGPRPLCVRCCFRVREKLHLDSPCPARSAGHRQGSSHDSRLRLPDAAFKDQSHEKRRRSQTGGSRFRTTE